MGDWTDDDTRDGLGAEYVGRFEAGIRRGRTASALRLLAILPPSAHGLLDAALGRLSADGFDEEVAIVDLIRRRPDLVAALDTAGRFGAVGGVVAFVACIWPAMFFAVIPAMAARILVTEIDVRRSTRRLHESLTDEDRSRARLLCDLRLCTKGNGSRVTRVDAAMLMSGGLLLLAGAVGLRSSDASTWFVWQLGVAGVVMSCGGALAVAATRRLARSGLVAVDEAEDAEWEDEPDIAPDPERLVERPEVFGRPRLRRSLVVPVLMIGCSLPAFLDGAMVWFLTGSLLLVGAGWLAMRATHATVTIDHEGVQDIGVFGTRTWRWADIVEARLETPLEDRPARTLWITMVDGSDRRLVTRVEKTRDRRDLHQLLDAMNRFAAAPDPGPTRRVRRHKVFILTGLVVGVMVFTPLVFVLVTDTGVVEMPPSQVPAGRSYTVYRQPDGSMSQAVLECPSLVAHVTGTRDPLCDGSVRVRSIGGGVLLLVDVALIVAMVLVARTSLRLRREARAARRAAGSRPA